MLIINITSMVYLRLPSSTTRWSLSSLVVEMSNHRHAVELKQIVENHLMTEDRPKSLLLFINPISGSGRANKVRVWPKPIWLIIIINNNS